jgi:cephalosporin hydroxylase
VGDVVGVTDADVIRRFHQICYERWTPINTHWMGVHAIKSPLDLWMYQEILHRVRPDVIIETGTFSGGSALFIAHMCDLLGSGCVVSVDVDQSPPAHLGKPWPTHPRLRYVQGDSAAPETVARVLRTAGCWGNSDKVMVILDSDHHQEHVARELAAYAPLVSVGSYLVVEDTNINGHPVLSEFGPGPLEAVADFLASPEGANFRIAKACERFLLTMNPNGFLQRVA